MMQEITLPQSPETLQSKAVVYPEIQTVHNISREEFYKEYVMKKRPVIIKGAMDEWSASKNWGPEYFESIEDNMTIATKKGNVAEGKRQMMTLSDYTKLLQNYEEQLKRGENPERPPYLHDVPIFHLLPKLVKDIEPFPLKYFPKWYWDNYQNYIQFFMGATNSLTPLHFDTLYTHNLFFQVVGRKKFILVPEKFQDNSYVYNWRWSKVDALRPDFEKFPLFKKAECVQATIGSGDILYIPPGMLHQVHGLSYSISFNIDWHTRKSVGKGLYSVLKGAPKDNFFYNSVISLGVGLKVPSKVLFPYYKSYLNYIS